MNRLGRIAKRLSFPPNQIAFGLSLRTVLAVALPLFVLRYAGAPLAGLFMALGALQIALADSGGPYRDRLLSMCLLSLVLPWIYFLGTQLGALWWPAALAMFVLAFGGGMLRALGVIGLPMGMVIGASFLVGAITRAPPAAALGQVGWFVAGCAWTVALTLAAWRLRPYLALQRQVGAALDAAARLLEAVPRETGKALSARELAVRTALEQARTALGATRSMAPATNPTLAQLYALLYVPSRLAMIAMDLAEYRTRIAGKADLLAAFDAALAALAGDVADAARAVIAARAWKPGPEFARRIDAIGRLAAADPALERDCGLAAEALRAAVTRLDEAAAASEFLARGRHRGGAWLPELEQGTRLREFGRALRAQLTLRSPILQHALRIGLVAGVAMAIEIYWKLPHGIWLTLTVLVVMQPDFGSTWKRSGARAVGTFAGVLVAGVVLVTLPWPLAREAAVAVLIFLTMFTLRFRYGLFVACLTPLVILLLALYSPGQGWDFVFERAGETVAGVILSLLGSLLLWPAWAGRRAPAAYACALETMGRYLDALLTAAADGSGMSQAVLDARRAAEVELANAETALQTMLAEPLRVSGKRRRELYFRLNVHLAKLMRHLAALGARVEAGLERVPALAPLADAWAAELAAAAGRLAGAAPSPPPHADLPDLASAPEGIVHLISVIGGSVEALVDALDPGYAARAAGTPVPADATPTP